MTGQTKINIGPVGADGDRWQDGESADRIVGHRAWRLAVRAGELADLTYAGRPVLRGIRFVVRDHDWRTAEDVLIGVEQPGTDSLILNVRSRFDHQDVVEWTLRATFEDATLRVRVEARALAQFRRNRIGLILLHHPDLAGSAVEVVHPDDSITETVFPTRIAPHQPARDVAGYRWRASGVDCSLRLAGDIFEMEDQRNWTDASYKTYSTPLDLPFPVEVGPGARVEQAVELHCTDVAGAADVPPSPVMIMPRASALPVIQVAASTAPGQPDPGAQEPIPVLVEIPADDDCWSAVLQRAVDDAAGADLDVRIVADRPTQVAPVIARLAAGPAGDRISRVGVFGRASSMSDRDLGHALAAAMTKHGLQADQVAGTRAHFTELNRHLEEFADWPSALTFSVTAQMHDRSRAQVLESLPMQRLVAEQAVRVAGDRPVHIGPVTLRARFNAVATTPHRRDDHEAIERGYAAQHVPEATDPRQSSLGLAAWTIASTAALAVPGIASITLYEAWGPRGIRQADGSITPAGRVIEWIRTGGELCSPAGLQLIDGSAACIAQQSGSDTQLLIGNIAADEAVIRIGDTAARIADELAGPSMITAEDDHALLRTPGYSTVRLIID